ncbi:MAG TPA: AraC family transcriptional regulator [Rhodanobacter sp.]|jgi:AraC family ethanolamine operon transcriptional activator|nr:AraC family transcriptional regulator [Rhodanobacter sp.]
MQLAFSNEYTSASDPGNERKLFPCDLVSLSRTLRVFRIEMVLLDSAAPRAFIKTRTQGDSLICSAECAFPLRGRFSMPAEWFLFGYIHHAGENSWCHAIPLASDTLFTVMAGHTADFTFTAGTRVTVALLPAARLRESLARLDPLQVDVDGLSSLLRLSEVKKGDQLRQAHKDIWRQMTNLSLAGLDPARPMVDTDLESLLDIHLENCLGAARNDISNCSRSRRRHYQIVLRTEEFMRANLSNDIYIANMCDAAETSERALRYAFDDLMGISPIRYLSMLRLCMARRNLSSSDMSRHSVKSVAMNCGLRDLSRFAESYRRIFGELPHDTLLRPAPGNAFPMN